MRTPEAYAARAAFLKVSVSVSVNPSELRPAEFADRLIWSCGRLPEAGVGNENGVGEVIDRTYGMPVPLHAEPTKRVSTPPVTHHVTVPVACVQTGTNTSVTPAPPETSDACCAQRAS